VRHACAFSEATVKTHLLSAYGKLGVSDRAAAVAVAEAFHRGLLVPGSPPTCGSAGTLPQVRG
jgi:hypothetical protein